MGDSLYTPATWTGGVVPYEFEAGVDAVKRQQFRDAAARIEQAAAVTFRERTNEPDYLRVIHASGNASFVGRQGGEQGFYIYDWNYQYILVHELMHALGMFHEHQRPDRDTYVTINACNIAGVTCQNGSPLQYGAVYDSNFAIVQTGLEHGPYDYDSIMHYARCDYSACCPWGTCACTSGCETITSPQPIGVSHQLSAGDIEGLRFLYSWRRPVMTGPTARSGHALSYDTLRDRMVMFGGAASSTASADLWELSAGVWTLRSTSGPAGRQRHILAFDPVRQRTVLFGGMGAAGGAKGDTWLWDGNTWQQATGTGPSPRYGAAAVFDSAGAGVLLFGGRGGTDMGDTWRWDGASWSLSAMTGPSARRDHAMAYDPARQRIVLFGGLAGSVAVGDTWEWDGVAWTLRATAGPEARSGHTMAFDAARGRTVLFGGTGADGQPRQDTWEWDGAGWSQRCALGPSARSLARMAYDSASGKVTLFGGSDGASPMNDTWTLETSAWCYANCDASTAWPMLNVADFTCFLQRFAAADAWANCDASTTAPTLNVADFTCFLQRFAQGCSN